MTKPLDVVVAVIRGEDGRVLVAHRDRRRHQGGGLEFPGGKIEPGESIDDALERELGEEVGVRPTAAEPFMRVRHHYGDRLVALHVRLVTAWRGQAKGSADEPVEWLDPAHLADSDFPEANRVLLRALCLPAYSPVTPRIHPDALEPWLGSIEAAMPHGPHLFRLRLADGLGDDWRALGASLHAFDLGARGSRLLVNADATAVEALPRAVGMHLGAAEAAAREPGRPVSTDRLLSCACHDIREIRLAEGVCADIGYLGPVKATPSHTSARPLGWDGFQRLAERTSLPLYAIGGLSREDLAEARQAGAVGVAGIRGFWQA